MAWGSAPGKLILFGEHAVVFGEPALATAIDLRTEVYARPHEEWLADGASLEAPKYRYVRAAVGRTWTGGPLRFEIRSMIPSGGGLGSSAAVTVATLAALRALGRVEVVPGDVAKEAFAVEHEVQGRASPIDTSTSAHGGGLLVLRERRDQFLWSVERDRRRWFLHDATLPRMSLVVGNTGISAATGPLVARVKDLVDRDPKAAAAVREIGTITGLALAAFRDDDLGAVGALMSRNHRLLQTLGVGHPMLDRLVGAVAPVAYGAKMTGAGGGGSIVALTDRPNEAAAAITAAGGRAFLVEPARGHGVEGHE